MSYKTTGWNDCPPILNISSTSLKVNNLNNGFHENNSIPESNATKGKLLIQKLYQILLLTVKEQLEELLEKFLGLPNSISPREFSHYAKKLKTNVLNINNDPHTKNFFIKILNDMINGGNNLEAKALIVNYMLVNPGVSTWALPLRKLVEKLNI